MGTGFLQVLGGALQGAGQGMVAVGTQEWEDRRALALAKLKGDYDLAEQDKRAAAATALADKQHENALDLATHEGAVRVETEKRTAPIKQETYAANKAADTNSEIRVLGVRAENEKALARLRSSLEAANDAASIRLRDALNDGDTKQLVVGADGKYRVFTNGGEIIQTNLKATEAEIKGTTKTTSGSLIERMDAARGGGSASRPVAEDKPGLVSRAIDGVKDWANSDGKPGVRPQTPQRVREGDKTYTMDDVRATARSSGKSEADVQKALRAAGYKLGN